MDTWRTSGEPKATTRVAQVAREVQVGPADLVAQEAMEAQVAMGATTVAATAVMTAAMTAAMAGAIPMIAVDPAVVAQVVVNQAVKGSATHQSSALLLTAQRRQ